MLVNNLVAAIEVADVTAGITANAVFFCNVTGAAGANNVQYSWIQTQNGVFPADSFPSMIFGRDRVQGLGTDTLTIRNIAGLEQNYDYRCTVSISDMVIGSATGALTSPGVYSAPFFLFCVNVDSPPPLSLSLSLSLSLCLPLSPSLPLSLSHPPPLGRPNDCCWSRGSRASS